MIANFIVVARTHSCSDWDLDLSGALTHRLFDRQAGRMPDNTNLVPRFLIESRTMKCKIAWVSPLLLSLPRPCYTRTVKSCKASDFRVFLCISRPVSKHHLARYNGFCILALSFLVVQLVLRTNVGIEVHLASVSLRHLNTYWTAWLAYCAWCCFVLWSFSGYSLFVSVPLLVNTLGGLGAIVFLSLVVLGF